jgi:hypothetical protein
MQYVSWNIFVYSYDKVNVLSWYLGNKLQGVDAPTLNEYWYIVGFLAVQNLHKIFYVKL